MSSERDEKAEKQAEGARSAINYMTKWENYIEGYERGWDAALESEQVRKNNEAVKVLVKYLDDNCCCDPESVFSCDNCRIISEYEEVKGK